MHEWALAEAVISSATEIAEKEGLEEVGEVILEIGELQQIEHDIFESALLQLRTPKLRKAKFTIRKAKAKLKCRSCENQWAFNSTKLDEEGKEAVHFLPEVAHTYIRCPKCGSPDFGVTEGRGILIRTIRGARPT